MEPLLLASEMKEADRFTITTLGIPDLVLMEHAALGLVRSLERRFASLLPSTEGLVLVGLGNNGGDAAAAARVLFEKGVKQLHVLLTGDLKLLSEATRRQIEVLNRLGLVCGRELNPTWLKSCDWVLDGVFGTGLSREVTGEFRDLIEKVNLASEKKWVVSADIPSGLSADTGRALGIAIRASETVTFGFLKRGLVTGAAADHVGRLTLERIQLPRSIPGVQPSAFLFEASDAKAALPKRHASGHKGFYGHVFVLGGKAETEGASALAALAALRVGAGLVSIFGTPESMAALRARLPREVMTKSYHPALFNEPGVLLLGPGMGRSEEDWLVLESALKSKAPLVLDADALNLMAEKGELAVSLFLKRQDATTCLTPHPKEASRLLAKSTDEIERDRFKSCRELVDRYRCFALLKGRGTVTSGVGTPFVVVNSGNSALSKGGSGDVLGGLVAGLLAQGLASEKALRLAAYLHGKSAERVAERMGSERAAIAGELAEALPAVFRDLECL